MRNKITNQSSLKAKIAATFFLLITLLFTGEMLTAQTAGPNLPVAGTNLTGVGTIAWTGPGGITAIGGGIASANLSTGASTNYLRGTNFGFAIPATSVINGIQLTIMRRASSTSNGVSDSAVRLLKAGVPTATSLAVAGVWPTSNATQSYGGATNLWGTTWTAADINATNFGAVLSATAAGNRTASVDYFQITVYYTPPPTLTNFTPTQACTGSAQSVVITGNYYTGATAVSFNGTPASFIVNNDTQITATLPAGATTGTISVTAPSGTVISAGSFTVNPLPVLPAIAGNLSVCIGDTTTLSNGVAGGTWSSGSPAVATIDASGVVSGLTPGNTLITYTYTNGNNCTNSISTTLTVNALPIVSAPARVCLGDTTQLSPATGGTWISNNPAAATVDNSGVVTGVGAGTATFTFTNTTTNCSNTTSVMTVITAPVINTQPVSQSVCSGDPASFTIAANGTGLGYQWYKGGSALVDGGSISGATSTTLTINPAALTGIASDYYCVVSGDCTSGVASDLVSLAVTERVIITAQPTASQNACVGDTVSFSVAATGAGLTYQWYNGAALLLDDATISGATTPTLTINPVATSDSSNNYYCLVSGTSPCSAVASASGALTVNQTPVINTQPAAAQSICTGGSVSFNISVTGTLLTYQWYKGGSPLLDGGSISGATSATLTINPAALTDAANDYYCMVSGNCTSGIASDMAMLTVNEQVTITNQPIISQNACTGETVSITVAATGTGLTYQWYDGATLLADGGSISGATTSTLTINPVAMGDASNNYYCLVSGTSPCTSVASANSILNVSQTPVINTQPAVAQTLCSGSSVSFSVSATGTSLSYQWYKGASPLLDGGNISGATSTTLTINPATALDSANDYYCMVYGNCSSGIASDMAALTVNQQVAITAQPVAVQNLCTGQSASFAVTATGTGLTFQWYNGATLLADGGTVSGATTSALTINPIALSDASNNYYCLVGGTSPCTAVASSFSVLNIDQAPIINTQPVVSQSICNGGSASLNVSVTGGNLSYKWYKGATLLSNGGNISGATTATLTINPFGAANAGNDYYCVVENLCLPAATSSMAQLSLAPQASIQTQTATTCSQTAFSVTPVSGTPSAATVVPANTTYSWTAPVVTGGMTGGAAQTNQNTIFGTLTNPTNTAQTATYTVTPRSGISPQCYGAPFTVTVTVNPRATIATINATVCSLNTVTVTPANGGGNIIPTGTTYSWGLPVVTGGITGATTGTAQTSLIQTLTNPTTSNQTATYTVTPTSGTCAGNPFTVIVTVYPRPVVNANTPSQTICHNSAPSIVISNPANVITSYSWTRDNTVNVTGTTSGTSGSIAAGNTFTIANTLTNTTGVPQTVIYTITPTANGCAGNPITATVIVNAPSVGGAVTSTAPGVLPAINTITVCHFASGTLYLSGYTGNVVRWEYTTTGGANWVTIANTATTYNYVNITVSTIFRAVVQNGGASCGTANSSVMMVNVVPNVKPSPVSATPSTICEGQSSTLFSQSGYATSQYIADGGTFSNANPENWTVDGCGNCLSAGASNTNPGPFQLSATNGGTYSGINYASIGKFAIANGNFNSILATPSFNTFGLTSVNLSFNHAFNLLAGAWVTVELSLDGGASWPVTLATWNGPATRTPYNNFPNTTINLDQYIGQSNLKVRFVYHGTVGSSWAIDNIQIPDAPNNLQTQWVDGNTGQVISTAATAVVSPTITTTYAITTTLNGCTSFGPEGTTYVTVTVNPRPTATIGSDQTICYGGTATFSIAMTGVAPWNVSYSNGTTTTTVNNVTTNPYVFSVNNITANQTYTVTNLSDSRCVASPTDLTGSAVVTVLNGTQGLWTGLVSTDWFDCRNWAGGLPSLTVNAVIPNGMPRMPMINPATSPYAAAYSNIAQARDVIIASGASLSMAASGTSNLQVSRDWRNSGVFNPGTGTVTFNSSTASMVQTINLGIKTNETFYNLITNVSNGARGISVVDGFQLTVSNNLELLSGDLRLAGEAQLVQAGTTPNPAGGTGRLLRDQQGTKSSFNYNYWSSPTSADGVNYTVGGVLRDGTDVVTDPFSPASITFGNGAYFADGVATTPIKISQSWINKYTLVSNSYFSWQFIGSTGNVKVGEGFTMKGTDGTAAITTPQNYVFVGKPNNGTINLNIAAGQSYLIGNPYASALDADQFIKDNIKDGGNAAANSFNGALYFWDHFGGNTHFLAQYVGGYATYTLMGGVVAIANSPLNINDGSMGSKVPKRYIPVSQGFFINTNVDPSLTANNPGLTSPVTGGPIVFKNTQRAFSTETPANSVFFRNSNVIATPETNEDTRKKIRLVFVSPAGVYRQILVGADANATNGFDLGYDGPMIDVSVDDMYWQVADGKLAIQAVPDFAQDRIIPLTLKANAAGQAEININSLENIGDETSIYLHDNQTDLYHDLKVSPFTVALTPGEHPNRFSLRFAATALGVGEQNMANGFNVAFSNNVLNIRNNSTNDVTAVALFNLTGQAIAKWDIQNQDQQNIRIPVEGLAQAAYIVKIISGHATESVKIIVELK
jgi:hypothetical protein